MSGPDQTPRPRRRDRPRPEPTEQQLEVWAGSRQRFGFSGDIDEVRRLYAEYGPSRSIGAPLSPSEEAEQAERRELRSRLPAVKAALEEMQPEHGGVFVTAQRRGELLVFTTVPLSAAEQERLQGIAQAPDRATFRVVRNSEQALNAASAQAGERFMRRDPDFVRWRVNSLGVYPMENRVLIGIDHATDEIVAEMRRTFPDDVYLIAEVHHWDDAGAQPLS